MLDFLHHASGDDLGIVEHLLEVVHACARHAGNEQSLLQFLAAAPLYGGLDQGEQRVLVGFTLGIGGKARIAHVGVETEHLHESGKKRIVGCSDGEMAAVCTPGRIGILPGSPVTESAPENASMMRLTPARRRSGPLWPKPDTDV